MKDLDKRTEKRLEEIRKILTSNLLINSLVSISPISKENSFGLIEYYIVGRLSIGKPLLDNPIEFGFEISPQYPFQDAGSESIIFSNIELVGYDHVMDNGSICIHTNHCPDLDDKLAIDITSLCTWIEKYYLNKQIDDRFEHLVVNYTAIKKVLYSYYFTEVEHTFKKGDYGIVDISPMKTGIEKKHKISNNFVQKFTANTGSQFNCGWSKYYNSYESHSNGLFYFIDEIPANHRRFIYRDWLGFQSLLAQDFLNWLYQTQNGMIKNGYPTDIPIPLFIGYKTVQDEINWNVAMLIVGKFPIEGKPIKIDGKKTGKWSTALKKEQIYWGLTKNTSYKYFFGRGSLNNSITKSKILIIGVGAVGSILAKTLVRGGCKSIDLADYDVKSPENVCRSEYFFNTGTGEKVNELIDILSAISPFVEANKIKNDFFKHIIKVYADTHNAKAIFTSVLNEYDYIFDCSTDNDLMYVLNTLKTGAKIINLSITNHAKDLVCATNTDIYKFVINQYENVLDNDLNDLYEPTGCWNPTFKASYNDISHLVQIAVKQINLFHANKEPSCSFVLKTNEYDSSVKLEKF